MRSSPRGVAVTLSNAAELNEPGVVARISSPTSTAAIPCARARVGFQGGVQPSRHLRGRGRRSNTEIGLARSESGSTLIVRVVP